MSYRSLRNYRKHQTQHFRDYFPGQEDESSDIFCAKLSVEVSNILMIEQSPSYTYRRNRTSPYAYSRRQLRHRRHIPRSRSAPGTQRHSAENLTSTTDGTDHESEDSNAPGPSRIHFYNGHSVNVSTSATENPRVTIDARGRRQKKLLLDGNRRYAMTSKENSTRRENFRGNSSDALAIDQVFDELKEIERAFHGLNVKNVDNPINSTNLNNSF